MRRDSGKRSDKKDSSERIHSEKKNSFDRKDERQPRKSENAREERKKIDKIDSQKRNISKDSLEDSKSSFEKKNENNRDERKKSDKLDTQKGHISKGSLDDIKLSFEKLDEVKPTPRMVQRKSIDRQQQRKDVPNPKISKKHSSSEAIQALSKEMDSLKLSDTGKKSSITPKPVEKSEKKWQPKK